MEPGSVPQSFNMLIMSTANSLVLNQIQSKHEMWSMSRTHTGKISWSYQTAYVIVPIHHPQYSSPDRRVTKLVGVLIISILIRPCRPLPPASNTDDEPRQKIARPAGPLRCVSRLGVFVATDSVISNGSTTANSLPTKPTSSVAECCRYRQPVPAHSLRHMANVMHNEESDCLSSLYFVAPSPLPRREVELCCFGSTKTPRHGA
jgi:hypothetical protein